MSEWLNNVGGVSNAADIYQQLKAEDINECLNSIYNYKEPPKSVCIGDTYFDKTEKVILGKMMNCVIADEF